MAFVAFLLVSLGRVGAAGPAPMDSASTEAPQLALGRYLADPKRGEGWSAVVVDIEASIENHTKLGRLRAIRRVLPFGRTEYEVLELEGDRTVRQQVIARYLSAEKEASQTHDAGIAMTSANYRFRYRGTVPTASRLTWAFEVVPRKKRAGLIRGELWIDAASGLVRRQAGRLVRTPSIFLRRVNVTRETEIRDGAACARVTRLEIDARFIGRSELTITERPFTPVAGVQTGQGGTEVEIEPGAACYVPCSLEPDLRIPSLSIRHCSVVRFRPRSDAAPLRPLITQLERCSASNIVRRSASSRVSCFPAAAGAG